MIDKQRGFSIAEVLTVTVICGLLLTTMAIIVPLMSKAPLQMQAQVDEVNTAAIALYKIRRDLSSGDPKGVLSCTLTPVVLCSPLAPGKTSVRALVVATADNGTGDLQIDASGYPKWQGLYVYWLVPNTLGTAFDLMRAYVPTSLGTISIISIAGVPTNVDAALTDPLVTLALLTTPAPVLTNNITTMNLGETAATGTINFELVAGTTGGVDQTSTAFESNTYARN